MRATFRLGLCAVFAVLTVLPACAAPKAEPRSQRTAAASVAASGCLGALALSEADCARVSALLLPEALPPAAGNRYGDDEDAAYFGFLMFYDRRFSTVRDVSCASCHVPENSFADAKAVSEVIAGRPLTRNAPSLLNAARLGPVFFWDGRADSLWSSPLFAIESPDEMNSSRVHVAIELHRANVYRTRYEKLFGALPDLSNAKRFPPDAKPGDAAYRAMSAEDLEAVDRIAANLGKMFEAYLRKVAAGRSKLDHFLTGDASALGPAEKSGLTVFAANGCIDCHGGPMLTDGKFHRFGETADRGRAGGIELLRHYAFNAKSAFFDRGVGEAPALPDAPVAADEGAFRTPSLRNVALTAPYGHAGQILTLQELLASGHGARRALTAAEIGELELFLMALNGAYPERPWSDWPAR